MHHIYLRPFFLNKCKAYLIEYGFEWGAIHVNTAAFHENMKVEKEEE
jgi:hypothetical protein